MNFEAYRAVWAAQDAGRLGGPAALLVALAMADRTDKAGETRQGVRTLADRVGLSRSVTGRAVRLVVAAGLYEISQPGTGHRVARYRLASLPRDARPGEKVGLASHGRDAIASQGSDLASQNGPFSVPPAGRSNRTVNASYGLASQGSAETPPDEVAGHVAQLRGRMNGKGGP